MALILRILACLEIRPQAVVLVSSERVIRTRICVNKRKWRKRDENGASFQSSLKINRMLITRLLCIQWKFTTPDQLASPSEFCSFNDCSFFRPLTYSLVPMERNQHFQAIEFVDRPIPEKLDIFCSFLFWGHEVLQVECVTVKYKVNRINTSVTHM